MKLLQACCTGLTGTLYMQFCVWPLNLQPKPYISCSKQRSDIAVCLRHVYLSVIDFNLHLYIYDL